MPSFSSIVLIAVPVSILALYYASQTHEPEPPLLPTNRRPHSGYTEPRYSHSPVETPGPTPRSVSPSTPPPRSGFVAGQRTFTARSGFNVLPPPPPPPPPPLPHSSVRGPQQYSFSRDNFPGTSTEVYRPTTKASVQNAVEPGLDSTNQAPPPESLFCSRKPQQYSFSGKDLSGPLIEPIDQPTTKVHIPKTAEPALDSVYQPPSPEPLFGTRKPQQYSFSKNGLPRTSVEPIHRPVIVAPVQKAPPPDPPFGVREPRQYSYSRDGLPRNSIDLVHGPATKALDQKAVDPSLDPVYQLPLPEPSFGTRKPQQYSYSRDDLSRNSVDQVYGPATKARDQKAVDLSLDPEPSFGIRRPQQYSYSRNDLPSPLVENVNRPAAKIPTQDTGEPSIINPFSIFLNLKNKGTVVDGGRDDDDDDDMKDLDHLALRKLANQEKENMKKCRTEEKLARRSRLLIRAGDLKVKAMRHEKRMQELNDRASEVVFAKNNKDPALRRIDLHGLTVNEAIGHTKRVLKQARELGNSEMLIIVGKGNHSKDGLPRLKPAIQTFLKENKFPAEVDPRNIGAFLVKLDSAPSC